MSWGRGGEGRVEYRPDNGTRGRRRRPGRSLRTGRARGAGLERELERPEQGREREPGDAAPPMVGPPGPSAAPSSRRRRRSFARRAGPSALGPQWTRRGTRARARGRARGRAGWGGGAGPSAPVLAAGSWSVRRGAARPRPRCGRHGPRRSAGALARRVGRARPAPGRRAGARVGCGWARARGADVTAARRRSPHLLSVAPCSSSRLGSSSSSVAGVEPSRRVETGGEGRARGQRSGGKNRSPGFNASRGIP